jgi:hypothetical protein
LRERERFQHDLAALKKLTPERHQKTLDYAIALQRAIEHHVRGEPVPDWVAADCPHHAEMLSTHLAGGKQQVSLEQLKRWPDELDDILRAEYPDGTTHFKSGFATAIDRVEELIEALDGSSLSDRRLP